MSSDPRKYTFKLHVSVEADGEEITTNEHTIKKLDYLNLCAVEDAAVGVLETLCEMGYLRAINFKGHTTEEVEAVRGAVRAAKTSR